MAKQGYQQLTSSWPFDILTTQQRSITIAWPKNLIQNDSNLDHSLMFSISGWSVAKSLEKLKEVKNFA